MPADIVVPELGESVVEARVARWLKKEGDRVSVGEALVELETDKIDLEVGATRAGVLASIARGDGEDVKIGEVLGVIEEAEGAADDEPEDPVPARDAAPPSAETPADGGSAAASRAESGGGGRTKATPSAARLARELDVELGAIHGSGERGRVTRHDVERHVQAARPEAPPAEAASPPQDDRPAPAAAPGETVARREERVRMSKRRQTIARRLVEAQRTAAMLTTFNEIDMTALVALRARQKQVFKERHGVPLGIASFFVKASIAALKAFPRLNAEVQGDEMVLKHYYDIGVAVGAAEGLVVPVLRDADRMSFAAVERAIRAFAKKAADRTLTLDDLMGGTFTVTNGGVFGSLLSTPILNPPQVGILGLHKIEERAVPRDGQVVVRPMMYVALSYDHRIVDGLEAVQFLVRVKELIEDPGVMILSA